MPRFEDRNNIELAQALYPVLQPSCEDCNDESEITLTGDITCDGDGLFLGFTCDRCGKQDEQGDGDFFNYYDIVNGEPVSKSGGKPISYLKVWESK